MVKNYRTATITWIKYHNFGTYLQAYALQQCILGLGYDNKIFDDTLIPSPGIQNNGFIVKVKSFCIKCYTCILHKDFCKKTNKINYLYNDFAKKYLLIYKQPTRELLESDTNFDQFICGSDQIWNTTNRDHHIPYFYAGFTKKKKIAYAASFGVNQYPEHLKPEFCQLVSDFAAISCREAIGCDFVREILHRNASLVVDPTLLLDGNQWRKIASRPSEIPENEYLLTYFITPNEWYLTYARDYASRHNLKLVTFYLRPSSLQEADIALCAGPSEFIWLIDHAKLVFTDSFHGSIFATHLETSFVGFKRFSGEKSGQNLRLTDLYSSMNISERFIKDFEDCERIETLPTLDFERLRNAIKPKIQFSIDFLRESLLI